MSVKFLKIDTFNADDTDALFVALCEKACDLHPNEAKITLSAEKLDKNSVLAYKASLSDLLALIQMYDIPFEFKVSFLDRGKVEGKGSSAEKKNMPVNESMVCDTYKQMEKQRQQITNPDLVEEINAPHFQEFKSDEATISPGSIPDFEI